MARKNSSGGFSGVGVDIGSFSIKVAGIKNKPFSKKSLLTFGIEHIPKDSAFEQRASLIQRALENAGIVAKKVNISVCGPNVITRYLHLPLMSKYELQDAIELEWDKYVSAKKEDSIWDFTLLDTPKDPTGKYMYVLLVVVKNDFITERVNLLKSINLEPQFIHIDALALLNVFNAIVPSGDKHPIVILNIGEYYTNQVVLKKNICWFSRDINIGGHDISGIIADKLRISLPEAENLKCGLDENRSKEIYAAIKPVLDNLANEVKLSVEYLKNELEEDIKLIYLFGGSAHLYNLDGYLADSLGMPIQKCNPASAFNVILGITPASIVEYSPNLAVAIGLALANKNALL